MEHPSVSAERALLGAVLLDPQRQQRALDWVQPGDMRRPWHAQVFEAMQRLRERGTAPGPAEVYAELQHDPDLPSSVARDGVLLANLMEAAPRAGHAGHYAVMVAESGIRQRLHLAGSRMGHAAETGSLEVALRRTAEARYELAACRARWLALPAPLRRELPAPARDVQAVARAAGQPRPRGTAAEAASEQAVRDLAAGPSHLTRVRDWLRPEYFARADHGALYCVMRDLDAAGAPVDPVTITWEAARRGVWADPASLSGGTGAFAVVSARDVRRHGLLAQVEHAGQEIRADAGNPACRPSRFLQAVGDRLRTLEIQAQPEPQPGPAATVTFVRRSPGMSPQVSQPDREAVS